MPHNTVDKKAIQTAEEYVSYCETSIDKIRVISRLRNEEGVKYALDIIRDLKTHAEAQKNINIRRGTHVSFTRAHGCEREETAFQKVLDLFESPNRSVQYYKDEISKMKSQLEKWNKIEKR